VILSAGLTPAWQQILVFESFRYGHVNRAAEAIWCASGKVFNAGIAVHRLGGPSLTLATVGGPFLPQIDAEFLALGVPRRWVGTRAATRVCTTLLSRDTGAMTELVENGRPVSAEELDEFRHAYAEEAAAADVAVLMGSLPVGTPISLYRELLEQTSCPAVLDFRGLGLLSVLDLKPYVVKPNREELASTIGMKLDDDTKLVEVMRSLNERGARWVVVTQGPGPVWVSSTSELYRVYPPVVEDVVNPIGCGDALAATIAWATRAGRPLPDAVRLGLAAAAQNIRELLPCRITPDTLEAAAERVQIEKVA
jgi:1-phosphofructokinase family hexose kinase